MAEQKMRAGPDRQVRKTSCNGACHCGRVRIRVVVPERLTVSRCNCSICTMTGFTHVIVGQNDLAILSGEAEITEYRFNTMTARHLFCRRCGVKAFYVPRSHPGGYSVNLNCLDLEPGIHLEYKDFDGRHWSKSIGKLLADDRSET